MFYKWLAWAQALEATCVEIIRRRRLSLGDRHEDVEKVIAAASKLSKSKPLSTTTGFALRPVPKGPPLVPTLLLALVY